MLSGITRINRITFNRGDHRQADTRIARSRLDDRSIALELTACFGRLDHRQCNAVFDRAARIRALRFDPHLRLRCDLAKQPVHADRRRVADRFQNIFARIGVQPVYTAVVVRLSRSFYKQPRIHRGQCHTHVKLGSMNWSIDHSRHSGRRRAAGRHCAPDAGRDFAHRKRTHRCAAVFQMREPAAHGRVQVSRRLQRARRSSRPSSAARELSHFHLAIMRRRSRCPHACWAFLRRS